ncbi:MAG: 16S rRNA (cytosine(1402)-N(4))-methyltransferase RsmH [Gemmataceae bacterium]|nr:16S rRNA (cytosine(1402)-N(4))-methyltransferase RsmH [Gemmataceae bacterium]MDW8264184.1 16S rRNA (cytosine(1402)-N(4))-methyltransferase RsmH [Gemmataceae bacterium]
MTSEIAALSEPRHQPVLCAEVLEYLKPEAGQTLVDATVGSGGHAALLVERLGPRGRLIALDQDATMLDVARRRLADRPITWVHANFRQLRTVLTELGVGQVDGVLAVLGVCSDQLDDPKRGLSFQQPGPLDMRLDPEGATTAAELLRTWSERDLADLFWKYGEERFSRRIARKIVETRRQTPLETTTQLADLICRCVPRPAGRRHGIHPATRVFQALRIAVNDEMAALEEFLRDLPECLRPRGRAVVISFHSLEDRRVKQAFRQRSQWVVLTPKPVQPTEEEVCRNPRARSAKLRAAMRN